MLQRVHLTALTLLLVAETATAAPQVTVTAISPNSPAVLLVGTSVQVSFDYTALEQNPRVVAIPYSNGSPSPDDSVHTDVLPSASGAGTCQFTILTGIVNVDALRMEMWSSNQPDALLFATVIPVAYAFNAKGAVYNLGLDPPSVGAMLDFGDTVHVAFSYQATEAVRIFFQPYAGYSAAPSSSYGPSVTLPGGDGLGLSYFTLRSEPAIVDRMRVQMWRSNMSILLVDAYLPISYVFGVPTLQQPVTWGKLKTKRW